MYKVSTVAASEGPYDGAIGDKVVAGDGLTRRLHFRVPQACHYQPLLRAWPGSPTTESSVAKKV
jgi:hypothetical protein